MRDGVLEVSKVCVIGLSNKVSTKSYSEIGSVVPIFGTAELFHLEDSEWQVGLNWIKAFKSRLTHPISPTIPARIEAHPLAHYMRRRIQLEVA